MNKPIISVVAISIVFWLSACCNVSERRGAVSGHAATVKTDLSLWRLSGGQDRIGGYEYSLRSTALDQILDEDNHHHFVSSVAAQTEIVISKTLIRKCFYSPPTTLHLVLIDSEEGTLDIQAVVSDVDIVLE